MHREITLERRLDFDGPTVSSNFSTSPGSLRVSVFTFGNVTVNVPLRQLQVGGQIVEIEPRPFELLILLLERAGEVVTNDEVLRSVWPGRIVGDAAVPNNIAKVRRALGDDDQKMVVTLPKVGYRLAVPVERKWPSARPGPVNLELKAGDVVPGRIHWALQEKLPAGGFGEVWIAKNIKTSQSRVFKFCSAPEHLNALKREVSIYRLLRTNLPVPPPIVEIFEWRFEAPPFFTESEFAGSNLRAWLDAQGGIKATPLGLRLHIVQRVAQAVADTHAIAVLHKDIKPENILISGEPQNLTIKLCDFGAGDLIDRNLLAGLAQTMQGFTQQEAFNGAAGMSTLPYMPPELYTGAAPSVQSDVYALGVLLYQMVVGDWGLIAPGWEADVADPLLREDIAAASSGVPSRRLHSAQLLADRLKKLDQRRAERAKQEQEQALAVSIQRELDKAAAQRPWIRAAGGVLAVSLVIAVSLFIQARSAAGLANAQLTRAENLTDFLINDIIRAASPDYGGKYDLKLKDAVLQSIPRIGTRFPENPLGEAALSQSMGQTILTLSEPKKALVLFKRAASLYQAHYGDLDRRTLSAQLDEALSRTETQRIAEIRDFFAPVYSRILETIPKEDPLLLKARYVHARLLFMDGSVVQAADQFKGILADTSDRQDFDVAWRDEVRIYYMKASCLAHRYDEVIEPGTAWIPELVARYGQLGRPTLQMRMALGSAHSGDGSHKGEGPRFAAAETEFKDVYQGYSELYGAESLEANDALQYLADLYLHGNRVAQAAELYKQIADAYAAKYGETSQWALRPLLSAAEAYRAAGNVPAAIRYITRARAIARKNLAPGEYLTRYIIAVDANIHVASRDIQHASDALDELTLILNQNKVDDPQIMSIHAYLLGVVADEKGEHDRAKKLLADAIPKVKAARIFNMADDAEKRLARLAAAKSS